MKFKEFMECFESIDAPIGDLARDILRDPDFPADFVYNTLEIEKYLMNNVLPEMRHIVLAIMNLYKEMQEE